MIRIAIKCFFYDDDAVAQGEEVENIDIRSGDGLTGRCHTMTEDPSVNQWNMGSIKMTHIYPEVDKASA